MCCEFTGLYKFTQLWSNWLLIPKPRARNLSEVIGDLSLLDSSWYKHETNIRFPSSPYFGCCPEGVVLFGIYERWSADPWRQMTHPVVKSWSVFYVHIVNGDGSSGVPVMWALAISAWGKNGNNVSHSTPRHSFQLGDQVCSQQRLLPAQNTDLHKHTHTHQLCEHWHLY